jgi:prevent-host-death family protein
MNRVISATEARVHFGELMRRVAQDEEPVIVERGGKPQAVVLSVDRYKRLLAGQQQDDWWALVEQARNLVRADLGDRELPPVEDIIREMREERDAQLDAAFYDLRRRKSRRSPRSGSKG